MNPINIDQRTEEGLSAASIPTHRLPYPIDRESQFGLIVAPVYDSLCSIQRDLANPDFTSKEWRFAAFPILSEYFKDRDLTQITFTVNDQMCMMTDPVMNEIRRIFNHEWFAQKIMKAAQESQAGLNTEDMTAISNLAHTIRCFGFSKFLGGEKSDLEEFTTHFPSSKDMVIDMYKICEISESVSEGSQSYVGFSRQINATLLNECRAIAHKAWNEWSKYSKSLSPGEPGLLTDPDHLWVNLACDLDLLLSFSSQRKLALSPLSRPTTFMIVEDNPLHQWSFSDLNRLKMASFYPPSNKTERRYAKDLSSLCYSSAKEAFNSINEAIINSFLLPNVIVADIELTDSDMNGLDLVEQVDSLLKEAGRRSEVEIVMVYSSNLRIHDQRVSHLKSQGIINESHIKSDFRLGDLLLAIESQRASKII